MNKKYSEDEINNPVRRSNVPTNLQCADGVVIAAEKERMVSVSGRVIEVGSDSVWAETNSVSACHHCSAHHGCGVSTLTKIFGRRINRIRVSNSMNAHLGDEVVLGIREVALLKETFVLYMTPLLSMLVAAAAINVLFYNEALSVLAAVCGFVIGLFMVRLFAVRNISGDALKPVMLSCKRVDRKTD